MPERFFLPGSNAELLNIQHEKESGLFDERLVTAQMAFCAPDLFLAASACLPDLEHYVSTHGPGPDRRLKKLKELIKKANRR